MNAELQSYIASLTDGVRRFTLERVAPHVKRTPWIPACAGMTIPTPVIPAEAGIQGSPKIMKDLAARQLGL